MMNRPVTDEDLDALMCDDSLIQGTLRRYDHIWGPIPLCWIGRAACLPGRALHVALAFWHISRLSRSRTVKMQYKIRERLGVSRKVYSRGLVVLEKAGLISVKRKAGSTPVVTLLGIDQDMDYMV